MSEPPEQEEEEPAADADLEELLEQFREPEEARRQRANPLWVVSGVLLTALAGWLALRASGGGVDVEERSVALAGAMLPGKTSERFPSHDGPVDVVEDYLARCKKGMTAQEVRWIVEDFQRAGLDLGMRAVTPEEYSTQRKNQHAWYLDLLTDGLGLSGEQVRAASVELDQLLAEALERFEKELEDKASEVIESGGKSFRIIESGPIDRLVSAESWLYDDAYAPWELCDLSPEQEAVTRRSEVEQEEDQQADGPEKDLTWTSTWADRETPFRSSLAETREILLADGEFGELATAGGIFPLEEAQLFEGEELLRINDPTRLHPAQLKMLLLLEPGKAAGILQALDKLGE